MGGPGGWPPPTTPTGPAGHPLDRLGESARGWQRIQLAVLGFIGFCGVLWAGGDPAGPAWLQWLAATLAAVALVLACVATYLVGRVAHRLPAPVSEQEMPAAVADAERRLRTGIRTTYIAVIVLAVAALSGWWPGAGDSTDTGAVEVRDAANQSWCGQLLEAPPGVVQLDTAGGPVSLRLDQIAVVRPVEQC